MGLPLQEAGQKFSFLVGFNGQLRAIAGCAKLNSSIRVKPEAVPAGGVLQPAMIEFELFRHGAQRYHHWANVEVRHWPSPLSSIAPVRLALRQSPVALNQEYVNNGPRKVAFQVI